MLTTSCILYGVSFWGSILIGLAGVFVHQRAMKRQNASKGGTPGYISPELGSTLRRFGLFWCVGLCLFLTVLVIEIFGVPLGLFADQPACPGYWPTPRALKNIAEAG